VQLNHARMLKLGRTAAFRATAVLALAAAGTFVAAGSASANVFSVSTTDSGATGGHATYDSGDEEIAVCDDQSDGLRAWAQFSYGSTRTYMAPVEDSSGAGTCNFYDVQSLPSGEKVYLEVCLRNGSAGALEYCATKTGTA
jgi:hypothetical protein